MRAVVGLSQLGEVVTVVDLPAQLTSGSVTGLSFYDHNTLFAFADPGTSGERLIRIDLAKDQVAAINAAWLQDVTNLNNTTVYSFPLWSPTKMIFGKATSQMEGYSYSTTFNTSARIGAPYINSGLTTGTAVCNLTLVQVAQVVKKGTQKSLLAASSGTNARLNIYNGIDTTPTCGSSLNYVSGTITASHIPVGVAQTSDGYV